MKYILFLIFTLTLWGCGGGSSDPKNNSDDPSEDASSEIDRTDQIQNDSIVTITKLEIFPDDILLLKDDPVELNIIAYNNAGDVIPIDNDNITWKISNENIIIIDDNKIKKGIETGSTRAIANINGVQSNSIIIASAKLKANINIVQESLIKDISDFTRRPYKVDNEYIIEVSSLDSFILGESIINPSGAAVVGEITNTESINGKYLVTLKALPINEIFSELKINEQVKITPEMYQVSEELKDIFDVVKDKEIITYTLKEDIVINQDGSTSFIREKANVKRKLFSFSRDNFECDTKNSSGIVRFKRGETLTFDPSMSIDWDVDFSRGEETFKKIIISGGMKITLKKTVQFDSGFDGSFECKYRLGNISVPAPGLLGFIFGVEVPYGLKSFIGGKIALDALKLELNLSAEAKGSVGFKCETNCVLVNTLNGGFEIKPKFNSQFLTQNNIQLLPSIGLSTGAEVFWDIGFGKKDVVLQAANAKVGVSQKFNLRTVERQLDLLADAADYTLTPSLSIGVGVDILELSKLFSVKFDAIAEFSLPKFVSPKSVKNSFSMSFPNANDVKFNISIDPETINYPIFGYQLTNVTLYRSWENDFNDIEFEKIDVQSGIADETEYEFVLDSQELETIDSTFFIFTETKPLAPLNLAKFYNELRLGSVSCTNNSDVTLQRPDNSFASIPVSVSPSTNDYGDPKCLLDTGSVIPITGVISPDENLGDISPWYELEAGVCPSGQKWINHSLIQLAPTECGFVTHILKNVVTGSSIIKDTPSLFNGVSLCISPAGSSVGWTGLEQPDPLSSNLIWREVKIVTGACKGITGWVTSSNLIEVTP